MAATKLSESIWASSAQNAAPMAVSGRIGDSFAACFTLTISMSRPACTSLLDVLLDHLPLLLRLEEEQPALGSVVEDIAQDVEVLLVLLLACASQVELEARATGLQPDGPGIARTRRHMPGKRWSTSTTPKPRWRSSHAVHRPAMPAPITTMSAVASVSPLLIGPSNCHRCA